MNLILAIFLIVFEAVFEGLKTAGLHVPSEIVEFVYLSCITLIAFAYLNRKMVFNDPGIKSFIKVIIGYILLRFCLFDIVWNISAGQHWNYYGTTKLYDKFMTALGSWGWFIKFCCGFMSIAFLTKWGNK